jgi:hypothetical protein
MSIKDKKILFFAPKFFGYEQDVKKELIEQGAEVFFLPDRPSEKTYVKVIYRLAPQLLSKISDKYYTAAVNDFAQLHYDFVFIQSGEALTIQFLKDLRKQYPQAKFIFYTYDSIANKKGQLDKIKFCDLAFSFDKADSVKYSIKFRPLFFSKGFEKEDSKNNIINIKNNYEYDLSFIGTAHSDRHEIISKIKSQLPSNIITYTFLFMQAKWLFKLKKIFQKSFKYSRVNDFNFEAISKLKVQEIFKASKAILDIEHPNQTGLTMRTFEALGAEKKLITTNTAIKYMDFYNSNNILIIDRNSPVINMNFFQTKYEPVEKKIYLKYMLKTWVNDIFITYK